MAEDRINQDITRRNQETFDRTKLALAEATQLSVGFLVVQERQEQDRAPQHQALLPARARVQSRRRHSRHRSQQPSSEAQQEPADGVSREALAQLFRLFFRRFCFAKIFVCCSFSKKIIWQLS